MLIKHMTPDENAALGLAIKQARARMRLSRQAFVKMFCFAYPHLEFVPSRLRAAEWGWPCSIGEGPRKRERYSLSVYKSALANFCNIKPEEYENMSTLGCEIRKTRDAKGWSRDKFVAEFKRANPTSAMSVKSLKRMELENVGSEQMFQATATFLAIPYNGAGIVKTTKTSGSKSQSTKLATAFPDSHAVKQAPVVTEPFKRTGAKTKNANGGNVLHLSFNNANGFSLVAARDTLAQLRALGLPTDQVKTAMIQKFTDYVNALDKN